MSILARLVLDNSGSLEKFELGAPSSSTNPKETISARGGVLVDSNMRVRFDLPSSINFRDINGFLKLGANTLIMGYPRGSRVVPSDFTGMIFY